MSQISCRTFFDWSSEDVAACGEQRALALRTQPHRFDQISSRHSAWPASISFVRNIDRYRRALLAANIHHLQLAVQLVNDLSLIVGTGPTHVPRSVAGDLCGFSTRHVVDVEIEVTVAIGVEEDVVANPHRIASG